METSVRLYALKYDEAKTYLWAAVFVACNLILPQLFHLIPQGGILFAPLSLVILAGAYKFGWKTGLLAAVLSPLVNHLLVAGLTAQYFRKVTLPLLVGVVLVSLAIGCLGELILTSGIETTIADVTIGWPGLLLQVFGSWLILKYIR